MDYSHADDSHSAWHPKVPGAKRFSPEYTPKRSYEVIVLGIRNEIPARPARKLSRTDTESLCMLSANALVPISSSQI